MLPIVDVPNVLVPTPTQHRYQGQPVFAMRFESLSQIADGATIYTFRTPTQVSTNATDTRCIARVIRVVGWIANTSGLKHWIGTADSAASPSTSPIGAFQINSSGQLRWVSGGTYGSGAMAVLIFYAFVR